MTTRPTTPPASLAVSMAMAKESLRIEQDDTSLDATITLWIKGITLQVQHKIGRALISQGFTATLDGFPLRRCGGAGAIRLDYPPIVSVDSIQFYDADNALQTLDPADYTVDTVSAPGYIVPAAGKAWPAAFARINAVTIPYRAGHGATSADVPENVQLYIVARLLEQFDPVTREFRDTVQSVFAARLLDACQVYS